VKKLDDKLNNLFSRRKFLAGAGTTAAAAMVVGCSDNNTATTTTTTTTSTMYTDADVLNYALNLEYLEAEFYLRAATGSGLQASDTTAGSASPYQTVGSVTVGSAAQVPITSTSPSNQQAILNEIAFEEQTHVQFLRKALGSAAVPRPAIDLSFFGPLAIAAGIFTSSQPAFNPFASFDAFLIGSFIFEDVGVTAYSGAAPLISAAGVASGYLTAAAGILAVEAYHAAYVRTSLTGRSIGQTATAYPYVTIANQVAALRATLTVGNSTAPSQTGSVETNLITPTATTQASAIVACDPVKAVGFARTVNQVHHIVYGSATVGVAKGGFFPNGTNSIFATTTA
jgi:hypothetical protein